MKINKDLCIGLLLKGVVDFYTDEELMKDKELNYIAKQLRKVNYPLQYGTAKELLNPQKYFKQMLKAAAYWETHSGIANEAWINAQKQFGDDNVITSTDLILAILRKVPSVKKWYNFNDKRLEKFANSGKYQGKHLFSSSRTATVILTQLDISVAHYHHNIKEEDEAY